MLAMKMLQLLLLLRWSLLKLGLGRLERGATSRLCCDMY